MDNSKHFWLRDSKKFPLACVVAAKEANVVRFAIAIVNPKDRFDRERGRRIAFGRLEKATEVIDKDVNHVTSLKWDGKTNIKRMILTHVAQDATLRPRIREAAVLWLNSQQWREAHPGGKVLL